MKSYERLLLQNKAWAQEKVHDDPQYFSRLATIQRPEFLWIGCSDSRVPANEITGTNPGEVFVHRNIANVVVATDMNFLSVLEYALRYLHVGHVIVCGHHGCGGVAAAMTHHSYGVIDTWLRGIKDVQRAHTAELDALPDEEARLNRLVELNVTAQVHALARTTMVQRTWRHEQRPHLHGWVYSLHDGVVRPQLDIPPGGLTDPLYRYDDV